jgi:hypothetical protein
MNSPVAVGDSINVYTWEFDVAEELPAAVVLASW